METLGYLEPGQRVGLLGGSFDPPHQGHAHITRTALVRFGLDRVIWLISPGNPLKQHGPAPMAQRVAAAHGVIRHPRVSFSDFEARSGTRYTAQTLASLRAAHPGVHFVWLMGADNLIQLNRWQQWRSIMESVPVGVLARPGLRTRALRSQAAYVYRHARLPETMAQRLPLSTAPAWCFLNLPMIRQSSSEIRARGEW